MHRQTPNKVILGSRSWHPSVIDNKCVKYYPDPSWQWGVMARTQILWPWPWRYDLGSRSWHTLGSWTTVAWNIIQIQLGSEELWPGHRYFDLGDMILGQGLDTPLGHGQQLHEISSRSNSAVRFYGPDTDFQYVCTVTLGQGHDTPLGHGQQLCEIISRSDKGVWSYVPDTMWTNRQTGWFLYIPPNFVCGGINIWYIC